MRRHIRLIRHVLRLGNASRAALWAMTQAQVVALRETVVDLLGVSVFILGLAFVLIGFWHSIGWATAKVMTALIATVLYLSLLAGMAWTMRTLAAAGLFLEYDFLRELARAWNNVDVQRGDDFKLKWPDNYQIEWQGVKFALHVLWVVVCLAMVTMWYMMVIPFWHYPIWFGLGAMGGIFWIIARKEFEFEFFKWFGSFAAYVFCIGGGVVYILVDYYHLHPYPIIPAAIAAAVVMFCNQQQWWKKWQGVSKRLAIYAAGVLLLFPYVGVLYRVWYQTTTWNQTQLTALAHAPLDIDWNSPFTLIVAGVLVIVFAGRKAKKS